MQILDDLINRKTKGFRSCWMRDVVDWKNTMQS